MTVPRSQIKNRRLLRTIFVLAAVCALLGLSTEIRAARFLVPLTIEAPQAGDDRPGMVGEMTRWQVEWSGGVAPFRFYFYLEHVEAGGKELMHEGRDPAWAWTPREPGRYRVLAEVEDDRGMIAESDWSQTVDVLPALQVTVPRSSLAPPVMSRMAIPWTTSAEGGAAPYRFAFQWRTVGQDPGDEIPVESGQWAWQPQRAGLYQVRAVAWDSLENRAESQWTAAWQVNPIFQVVDIVPDRILPIADHYATVLWSCEAEGGSGDYRYRFELYREDELIGDADTGDRPEWRISGWESGAYRVRTIVEDGYGHQAEGWSKTYRVGLQKLAVIPLYNLSNASIPSVEIRQKVEQQIRSLGYDTVPFAALYAFMREKRWRNTAYLSAEISSGLREELDVDGVVLTGVLDYLDSRSPRIAIASRLVGTGPDMPIIWAFGHAGHGEKNPGFLNLGRIYEITVLQDRAMSALADDLAMALSGSRTPGSGNAALSVALFPFDNHTDLNRGGDILMATLLVKLVRQGNIKVLEPGVVRESLLTYRIIAPDGPSQADLYILSKNLDAGILLTGTLTRHVQADFDPARLPPEIGYVLKVFDLDEQAVAGQYSDFGKGDDDVYFYDVGRFWTSYDLSGHLLGKTIHDWLDSAERGNVSVIPKP